MLTYSAEDTIKLGRNMAKKLRRGDVVALYGDLGSGKTTFTKGIGEGLNVKNARHINSPTFVLIKEYKGNIPMYHVDLYRLDDLRDMEDIGIEEYVYGDGVCVIEWAEKAKNILPKRLISVRFKIKGDEEREIKIENPGD